MYYLVIRMEQLYAMKEASSLLGVYIRTIQKWDKEADKSPINQEGRSSLMNPKAYPYLCKMNPIKHP